LSNRIDKISEEVMRALSDAIRTLKDPRVSKALVSITHCDVTGDLRYAKVYVSAMGSEEDIKEALRGLRSAAGFLRREVGMRVNLRYTPEILIERDDSINYGAHINELIKKVSKEETRSDDNK